VSTTTLPPIFADAVAKDVGRWSWVTPFVILDQVYATDGKVCVRAPKPAGFVDPDPTRKPPPANELGWLGSLEGYTAWPLPELDEDDARAECEECSGTGVRTCNLGHDHECEECHGNGGGPNRTPVDVGAGDRGVQTSYAVMLRRHGVTHVYRSGNVFYFRGSGFEGLLAAMVLESQ
jgi:hypothetical protein